MICGGDSGGDCSDGNSGRWLLEEGGACHVVLVESGNGSSGECGGGCRVKVVSGLRWGS